MVQLSSVLLVEDDPTTNFLNQRLLKSVNVGAQVQVAYNGAEALDFVQAAPTAGPRLILLDVNMPVMSGIEFLEAYQQLPAPQRHGTVVVLLTTTLHTRDLERARELAVADIINKPLTKDKLLAVLDKPFTTN